MVQQVFVARERELERLDGFLQRALAAQGAVCFVTGEAGSGKTALVTEFTRRAQEAHEDLVVAMGQSDAQTGIGDPYLPFREVLGQLTGDVDAKLAQGAITDENASRLRKLLAFSGRALVEVGPDLIELFVPWAGLATRAASFAADKVGWLDRMEQLVTRPRGHPEIGQAGIEQEHIFEQYTNVLNQLAEQQPLLVVLDDLQWADAASISLLFRLGRRIGGSRILIVGTYRPEEVALGRPSTSSGQVERHPLEKVLAEFKRYYGDLAVDLDAAKEAEGRRFVDALLDSESNRLGERFRSALFQHTDGHPLFTIELLRDMQERGDLVQNAEGQWMEGPALDWDDLPARVEGVIEERIGRLEAELREALTVGSVEGEDFTAEVVAQVQATEARELIRRLSGELAKQHRLVSGLGVRRVEGRRLSLYRFQHNLFQTYLYNGLTEAERAYLHEDVATVLEELYGDRVDEIAVQLARHFVEARISERARVYLRRAGEQAAARFANDEAVEYFSRALDLTPEDDLVERYDLLLAREKLYDMRGEREAQMKDVVALQSLAEALSDDRRRAEAALWRARHAEATSDYPATTEAAQNAVALARTVDDLSIEASGYLIWGGALWRQGDYGVARQQFERALALARAQQLHELEAGSLCYIGRVLTRQSQFADAEARYEQALRIYREMDNLREEGEVLTYLGANSLDQGDYSGARTYAEQALDVYSRIGYRRGEGAALGNLGIVHAQWGDYAAGKDYLERALRVHREIGDLGGVAANLNNLGSLANRQGQYAEARDCFEQVVEICHKIGHRRGQGITLNNLGGVAENQGDYAGARAYREQALCIFREIGNRGGEGLMLGNLGDLALVQGDYARAREYFEEALDIAREIGNRQDEGLAVYGLGALSLALGDSLDAKAHLEQCLEILCEVGDPKNEGKTLSTLGRTVHLSGDHEAALEYGQRALKIGRELDDQSSQGRALTLLGHIQADLGHLPEAADAYRQALTLRRELGQLRLSMEPMAGLARVYLAQGDLAQAQLHLEDVLGYLEDQDLAGTEEPFRIYLVCYQVLRITQDPRAGEILVSAYDLLQERASKITNAELRRSFVEDIPSHREIVRAFEASQKTPNGERKAEA
jgi:adenylate cyclase